MVTYVVTRRYPGSQPSSDELGDFVAEHLAAYKVPEAIFVRSSLPTSRMGKVDRAALLRGVALERSGPPATPK